MALLKRKISQSKVLIILVSVTLAKSREKQRLKTTRNHLYHLFRVFWSFIQVVSGVTIVRTSGFARFDHMTQLFCVFVSLEGHSFQSRNTGVKRWQRTCSHAQYKDASTEKHEISEIVSVRGMKSIYVVFDFRYWSGFLHMRKCVKPQAFVAQCKIGKIVELRWQHVGDGVWAMVVDGLEKA